MLIQHVDAIAGHALLDFEQIQHGVCEIDQADSIFRAPPTVLGIRMNHDPRHPSDALVQVVTRVADVPDAVLVEVLAVVAGDHHDRGLQEVPHLQLVEQSPQLVVDVGDRTVVLVLLDHPRPAGARCHKVRLERLRRVVWGVGLISVQEAVAKLYGVSYEEVVRKCVRESFGIRLEAPESEPRATVDGFVMLPLLATLIAAGQPLVIELDPEHDSTLAFRKDAIKTCTRPVCLRIGRREASMAPTIRPGDVVVIDQNIERRRHPEDGHVYVVNLDALEGDDHGGGITRVETSGGILILTADNPDKTQFPTRALNVRGTNLPDILVGEVAWYMGRGKRR